MNSGWIWKGLALIFPVVFIFPGCKPGKKSVSNDIVVDSSNVATELTNDIAVTIPDLSSDKKELVAILIPLADRKINFKTFDGKAKASFQNGSDKVEFNAGIRMQKDSVIWVSVNALGGLVQVARLLITPDSIYLVNYLQREVTLLPTSEASKLLPADVNFDMLQSLIIGNLVADKGIPTDAADIEDAWSLQLEDRKYRQLIAYNKADTTMRSNQVTTRDVFPETGLLLQFGNYKWINNQRFPINRVINIVTGDEKYHLDMQFNSVAFDEPVDFPFSIPKKYTMK